MLTGVFAMSRSSVRSWPWVAVVVCVVVLSWSTARGIAEGARQDASSGNPQAAAAPAGDAGAQADQLDELVDEGQGVFTTNCFDCHMPGGAGPKLDGDTVLANKDKVIAQIIKGSANGNMPPFGSLPDRDVAAVATFVRNTGSNTYGVVLEADVARVRQALKAAAHQ
jgi:mono/diheme cytochrome c family protein